MMKKIVLITLVIAFLLGMNADVKSQTITTGSVPHVFCLDGFTTYPIPYTIIGTFNAGNIFTAQISDANGNFTNSTNLGTLSSTTSGTITATFPQFWFDFYVGYRIRVVSSSPAIIGTDNGYGLGIDPTTGYSPSFNGPTVICQGTSTTFVAGENRNNMYGYDVNYQWQAPSDWSPNYASSPFQFQYLFGTTAGHSNGNITLTISNHCGTFAPYTLAVRVVNSIQPQPSIITGNATVCAGTQQTYS